MTDGDMNEAKEELLKVKHMSLKIEQLSREREALLGLKGVVKGEKVQSSKGCGSVESVVIRRMKLQERIQELIASYIERRQIVIETIHKLDNNLYIQILYKRYINGEKIERIARELGYSESYIKKIHRDSLIEYQKKMRDRGRRIGD